CTECRQPHRRRGRTACGKPRAGTACDCPSSRLDFIPDIRLVSLCPMPDLSPKQLEVLDFIRRYTQAHGWPPTRGEIARGLGLRNRQGIDQHLRALESKGSLELMPGISRGIRLRESFERRAASTFLPLLGRIAAGSPILATGNIEEQIAI